MMSGDVLEGTGSCWKGKNNPDVGRLLSPNRKQASSFKKVSFNYENWQPSKDTWQLNFVQTFALAVGKGSLAGFMKKSKQFAVSPQFPLSLFHKNKR
jgi:hypothetical protein